MDIRGFSIGLFCACVAVSVKAQAPAAATAGSKLVVEGCVERAQPTGSLGGSGVGTTSSPNTAPGDANSGQTLDVFMLTDAKSVNGRRASGETDRTAYALEGHEREFDTHTGHRVQVSGVLAPPRASRTKASSVVAAGIRRIRVNEVKMLGATCSPISVR
jgi:hypothetical protein